MLSYQHIYHAGNRADVHKHLWLITVLEYLLRKDKPLTWIDTHAGRGIYDLNAPEAQKLGEYKSGVMETIHARRIPESEPTPVQIYRGLIAGLNKPGDLSHYPGSAHIVASRLRPSDRLHAFELHKGEIEFLSTALGQFQNATIRKEDGLKSLISLVPPPSKRGGVLIDPSYEIKTEYGLVADTAIKAHRKWEQGIYMVWYPMLKSGLFEELKTRLADSIQNCVIDEWIWGAPESTKGLYGSGMIIINAPYTTAETMQDIKSRFFENKS